MACETLCIYGESGTGKSTSLRNMNPETTFIISTTGKPLPFRAWKSKYKKFTINKETKEISGNYYMKLKKFLVITIFSLIGNKSLRF